MPTNYSTLVGGLSTSGSIKAWTNKGDCPSEQILDEAQAAIFRILRIREMETVAIGTLTASATAEPVPSDYLGCIDFRLISPDNYPLNRITPVQLEVVRSRTTSGEISTASPSNFTVYGTNLEFDSAMDQARVYRLAYYKEPARLSTLNETNFLTQKGVKLLNAACYMAASQWKQDMKESEYWEQQMQIAAAALSAETVMEQSNLYIPWVGY